MISNYLVVRIDVTFFFFEFFRYTKTLKTKSCSRTLSGKFRTRLILLLSSFESWSLSGIFELMGLDKSPRNNLRYTFGVERRNGGPWGQCLRPRPWIQASKAGPKIEKNHADHPPLSDLSKSLLLGHEGRVDPDRRRPFLFDHDGSVEQNEDAKSVGDWRQWEFNKKRMPVRFITSAYMGTTSLVTFAGLPMAICAYLTFRLWPINY